MSVGNIRDAVVVIVGVEVIGRTVRIQVAGPCELVNASVVVIVFVVATRSSAVVVLIGHAVVVVVHGILVSEVEIANGTNVGVRMVDGRVKISVGGNVSRVQSLGFKRIVVNRPFENTVVVIVPVVNVENTVVVVVVRVGSVAAVKPFEEVVNAVVVVVKVGQIVDTVVVVVACPSFFKERRVRGDGGLQDRQIDDDSCRNTRVRPHEVGQGLVGHVQPAVVDAVPATLTSLFGGLNRRHAKTASVNQTGRLGGLWAIVNGLNDSEQAAGQHQKHDRDGHGKSLSFFDFLCVLS